MARRLVRLAIVVALGVLAGLGVYYVFFLSGRHPAGA